MSPNSPIMLRKEGGNEDALSVPISEFEESLINRENAAIFFLLVLYMDQTEEEKAVAKAAALFADRRRDL